VRNGGESVREGGGKTQAFFPLAESAAERPERIVLGAPKKQRDSRGDFFQTDLVLGRTEREGKGWGLI